MAELTDIQKEILEFIVQRHMARSLPPTVREIAAEVGITAWSSVAYHVDQLQIAGCVTREKGVPRSIQPTEKALESASGVVVPRELWMRVFAVVEAHDLSLAQEMMGVV